ncbi:ABC transporter permease subunit [bacterium]|nr:ABC transporter permease subunit [bacterium]
MTGETRRNTFYGLLFISPWIVGFTVFMAIPLVLSFYFSFCDYSILNAPVFIGAQNYQDMVSDEVFWKTLRNTAYFAALSLPLGTVLALALALLLNTKLFARAFFRTVFFLPSLVPLVALAILWREVLHVEYGIVNSALRWVGIGTIDWLGDPRHAMHGLVFTSLWGIGNSVVLYLASLQDVPRGLYEAAEVDGANAWQRMVHVTLPMISPVIYFNLLMGCIGALQVFALPYVMTKGEPARSTMFYTMYLFDQAFSYLNMGYASALAWILFLLIALLSLCTHLLSRRYVHQGDLS